MKSICIWTVVFLLVVSFFWQCSRHPEGQISLNDQQEQVKEENLFGHRWWNYYQRGLSFIEREEFENASADFEQAILQRNQDQRMARTYGMHFIDYFPHREKGIALYKTGNLEDAQKHLQTSLENTPSAKTQFYLDLVRRAIIDRSGGDTSLPELNLDIKDGAWTNADPVIVSGDAMDDQYVAAIRIRGNPVFLEGSNKQVRFAERLALRQGEHQVEVAATNLWGGSAKKHLIIHVDRQGPLITLGDLRVAKIAGADEILLSGFLHDEGGVSEFSVNGEKVPIRRGVEVPFQIKLAGGVKSLEVVAKDRLGNNTSGSIPIVALTAKLKPLLLASAGSGSWEGHPFGTWEVMAGLFDRRDSTPPTIQLGAWDDHQIVLMEKIYLEGQVTDTSKIESLQINNTPILRRKGRTIVFGHVVELKKGKNRIVVEATDGAGNAVVKTITVFRRVPKALQLDQRLSLTVLPFGQENKMSEFSLSFNDSLIDALVGRNRFRVVERDKLEFMFEEQKLSRSDLIEKSTAIRVGRLLAAQCILTGTIIDTHSGIEIVARVIDTETTEILSTQDVYMETKNFESLTVLAEGLALKFHHDFPLVDGVVIKRDGEVILTDLVHPGVKLGRKVIVYREIPVPHPLSGKGLGLENEIIDHARIIQVSPGVSKARLEKNKPDGPKPLDKVISS